MAVLAKAIEDVPIPRRPRQGFASLDPAGFGRAEEALTRSGERLAGRVIWHVTSSHEDGVASILRSLLGYARDGGVDAHWLIASADHDYHPLTRRLCNRLHGAGVAPTFTRFDGSTTRVDRAATIDQDAPIPGEARIVAQISGWERLKDQSGLLRAFADHCDDPDLHPVLAGPHPGRQRPESEEQQVLDHLRRERRALPDAIRSRVHLAELPLVDLEENAAMVNAIQRRADIVVHKSLQEGFGLSVTEAMLKGRPVIASRVGGIQDQIVDGESGILIDDPRDLEAFGRAICELSAALQRRQELGEAARARALAGFLASSHLADYLELVEELTED